ncbi:MAG: N-acetyltransferase [Anaerolineae bacterium]|nr:N-acetyltransferase [Anaerolineae bacterium]
MLASHNLSTPQFKELTLEIRKAIESDRKEILNVHNQAFGKEKGPEIAKLVDDLLNDKTAMPILSLVAIENERIIGHVLYTKATITPTKLAISAQILAPLAILPDEQKKGIGEKLINEGIRQLKEFGTELVFVLGHPSYYPRCGFFPAGEKGFEAPYPIPEEHAAAWMVQSLNGDALETASGKVQCSIILNEPQHWRE